ncbi:hypothetical protein FRC00_010425, partial [Tulasnella sp. 408]
QWSQSEPEGLLVSDEISLFEELTHLDHEPTPTTENLVAILQALGRAALNATFNKHKIYTILLRSRDICNYILGAVDRVSGSDGSKISPEVMLEAIALPQNPKFVDSSYFDDCAWLSYLLHEVIGPEVSLQFPQDNDTLSTAASVVDDFILIESAIKSKALS